MKDYSHKFWTIPNIITIARLIIIIPMFVTFFAEHYLATLIIITVSGVSDVVDGIIARKFNMISEIGKILDPIADKLTQLSILALLSFEQPLLLIPFGILAVKELTSGIIGIHVVKQINHMLTAEWHGKLSTVFLYLMMGAHMLMLAITGEICVPATYILIAVSSALILLSFVLYLLRYRRVMREHRSKQIKEEEKTE
ncbi:MAG: CDP-alcohol phosphatidyltransferase family protein [Clostridia bacterium]|nr:CDP-alcohol phosphatidyltransferase family protein [Clostridia bacterium]